MKKIYILTLMAAMFFTVKPAYAESNVPPQVNDQMNSIFQIIEGLILQDAGLPTVVTIAGCTPTLSWGFFTLDFRFVSSPICTLNGNISFGLFPLRASVRLEIMNNPFIQAFDADLSMTVKKGAEKGSRTFAWNLTNGRVAFRMGPGMPLNEWILTGNGTRVRTSTSLNVNSRLNAYDKATGSGKALVRTITQVKPAAAVKKVQSCDLTGAMPDSAESGNLANCVDKK